jgi:hypothetical protein
MPLAGDDTVPYGVERFETPADSRIVCSDVWNCENSVHRNDRKKYPEPTLDVDGARDGLTRAPLAENDVVSNAGRASSRRLLQR